MAKKKLLIVDDEKDFIAMVTERLAAKGFEIIEAFDGKDGIEKAHIEKPDIILLDIMMPEMNGYDMCRKLKIDENYKDIPIIMVTAKFQPNDVEFGKEMGADAYLTKPVELEALYHKIDELLRLKMNRGRAKKGHTPKES